jgi:pimeloyl-ACP methyl ester carboxylesterase
MLRIACCLLPCSSRPPPPLRCAALPQAIQEAVAATATPSPDRGTTRFVELPGAGHWVHVDNPAGLVELVLPSLVEASQS